MNLILGGTSGLGFDLAHNLQERGEDTFVIGRSYNEAEHGRGRAVDLLDQQQVNGLIDYVKGLGDTTLKRFFWVAGKGYNGDFAKQSSVDKMTLANYANVVPVAQAVWQKMIAETEPTNFVVVSSRTGVIAREDEAVYAGTKHAQVGFTRSLGLESERLGASVRVALFLPGGMQTPFWDGVRPERYEDFMDPVLVAQQIVEGVYAQQAPFYEEMITKDSLNNR